MSAKHALLGLLMQRSAYPYELADRLRARLGPTWQINSGQLYQTIRSLEREGLVEQVAGAAEGRDDRHVFSITESGAREFERWWFEDQPPGARLFRRPLLVKLTLAGPDRLKDALQQIDAYERDCAERLNEIARMREEVPVEGTQVRADHVLLRLGLSGDIFQLEGELRWARHAHDVVSWLLTREAVWPRQKRPDELGDLDARRKDARAELFRRMARRDLGPAEDREDR